MLVGQNWIHIEPVTFCTNIHEEGTFWSGTLSDLHLANPSPSIALDPADFLGHVEELKDVWS